jgi:hypothetical protein
MGQTEATRQSDNIWPPIVGSILVLPLTTSVLILDMTTFAQSPALPQSKVKGSQNTSPMGQYLTAISLSNFFFAFGPTAASLSGLSTTATSTVVQSGAFSIPGGNTTNGCIPWAGGVPLPVRLPPGPEADPTSGEFIKWGTQSQARFLGLILAAGAPTSNIGIWVSSE